jgi:hypothetical protein
MAFERCSNSCNIRTQLYIFRTTILCSWNIILDLLKYFPGFRFQKDKEPIEKPIVLYYAKYIGLGGTNKSLPMDEGVHVRIYDDRIDIDFLDIILWLFAIYL